MKIVAQNRRARYDYDVIETMEAGIVLEGHEAKSCRAGQVHLGGAYVSVLSGKPILKGATISPYAFASGLDGYSPERDRVLLLKKTDIDRLDALLREKGLAVIPLEVRAGKYIKILLGLGKGRRRIDKRQKIKEKDTQRRLREGREI